jgi:HK97 family phage portal protein
MAWPFSRKIEVKENPVGASFVVAGGASWKPQPSRKAYIEEGYQLNVVVYRSVREISRSISDLEIELVGANGDVIEKHPALDLLARPNPTQGFDGWITEAFTNYMLTGEMAIMRYPEKSRPVELWNANPINIKVEPGRGGMPGAYIHEQGNVKTPFPVEYPSGRCQMFFMKMYDPLDYWRGQSPLVAAGLAADTHNAGMRWNYSLLRNSARPSGLIKLTADAGGEVIGRLKEWFKGAFQGERKAGEIPVLPAGAEWQAMDNTARDMDFMNTQKEAAKLIASAFGVPLPLIDNDASTFNNLEQAKERFYSDTILPMFREFLNQFGAWLLPMFGDGLRFQVNEDKIGALEGVRTRLFDRMVKAYQSDILTRNEAREAIGYDPISEDVAPDDVAKAAAMIAYGDKPPAKEAKEDPIAGILEGYLNGSI